MHCNKSVQNLSTHDIDGVYHPNNLTLQAQVGFTANLSWTSRPPSKSKTVSGGVYRYMCDTIFVDYNKFLFPLLSDVPDSLSLLDCQRQF